MNHYTAASVVTLLFIVSVVYGDSCSTECEALVTIDSGPICGRVEVAENSTKFYSFQGVPYGKPPLGLKRFGELESVDPWTDTFYAYEEGPACSSRDFIFGGIAVKGKGTSEDCIYANVFVPATATLNANEQTENLLPILINIHGGAFNAGSGNRDLHGPELLVVKGVIVVNFNYRLGVLGFLSLASAKIPGNAGLRDQVTLMKWVQRNARAFGGDPNQVTVIGDSAGGASINLLMMSDATEGLFKRTIMMSGTAIPTFYSTSPVYAKYVADLFLSTLGITSTDADEIHQILSELPLDTIMKANDVVQYTTGLVSFGPVVETATHNFTRILEDDPIALLGKGKGKDIPALIGFNKDEAETFRWLFMMLDILGRYNTNPAAILSPRLAYELSTEEALAKADTVSKHYFESNATMDGFIKATTHAIFQYPSIKLAHWRTLLNGSSTYLYRFSYQGDFSIIKRSNWLAFNGTGHVEDLTYVFRCKTFLGDHVSIPPQTKDDNMRDWMSTLISNFVKCGTPTCGEADDSQWPTVNKDELKYQAIEEPGVYSMSALSDEIKEMIVFTDSYDDQIRTLSESLA